MLNLHKKNLLKFFPFFPPLTGSLSFIHEVKKDIYRSANKNNEVDVIYVRQVSEDYGFICTAECDSVIFCVECETFFLTKCELWHMCVRIQQIKC